MTSQTVPDDSYSIKDILTRFTRGIDPMLTKLGEYDNEEMNSTLSDTEFDINPLRTIEDLTDIGAMEEFLKRTEMNKRILIKRIEEEKKKAENSADAQ
jgi:hypothetical protein